METPFTSRNTPRKYHYKRRNAVAYNPDTTCTEDKGNLIAHIMATNPPLNQDGSKLFSKEIETLLILRTV